MHTEHPSPGKFEGNRSQWMAETIDCNILLPNDVRVRDVAKAIGILMGGQAIREPFHHGRGWSALVPGVQVKPSPMPECVEIYINFKAQDDLEHWLLFHYEVSGSQGKRLLSPPSTPLWCAVGDALVNFFGGHVDYNDADDETTGPQKTVARVQRNDPSDDPEWGVLQERLMNLGALTAKDIRAHKAVAAWKGPR